MQKLRSEIMDWWIVLLIVIVAFVVIAAINYFRLRKGITFLTEEEFTQNIRKAQVVDVRDKDSYEYGHIIGARNIPYELFRQRAQGLRKDQPIYLYDKNGVTVLRAAQVLKKKGYRDIYVLKDGISKWNGKIKSKTK